MLLAGNFDAAASVLDMCSHPHQDGNSSPGYAKDINDELAATEGVTLSSLWNVSANRLKMRAGIGVALWNLQHFC